MSDLFSKISEILSNPEASQKIREIASSMSEGQTGTQTSDLPSVTNEPSDPMALLSGLSGGGAHSRDLNLLNAMRPYLRSSRAAKIDSAVKAIRMIEMLSALR